MDFYIPNADVYTLLQTVATATGATVDMGNPDTVATLPAITYYNGANDPTLTHDKEIATQTLEIIIDIWSKTASSASAIMVELVQTMHANNYMIKSSNDVPDPTEGVVHKTMTFKLIK